MGVEVTNSDKKKTKLERIEQRIAQLERQKRSIQARENDKRRKARTRRLVQIGAIAIKYLNCETDIEPRDFEKRIKDFIDGIEKNNQTK